MARQRGRGQQQVTDWGSVYHTSWIRTYLPGPLVAVAASRPVRQDGIWVGSQCGASVVIQTSVLQEHNKHATSGELEATRIKQPHKSQRRRGLHLYGTGAHLQQYIHTDSIAVVTIVYSCTAVIEKQHRAATANNSTTTIHGGTKHKEEKQQDCFAQ